MTFQKKDASKNQYMLTGSFARQGYDWWWHSFTGKNARTGEERAFFVEFFLCNPALGTDKPILGQSKANQQAHRRPSYLMVKAGCWGQEHKQLHRFFGWTQVSVSKDAPYRVAAEDCIATDCMLKGSVSVTAEQAYNPAYLCDEGSMSWNLRLDKQIAFNVGYGTSPILRAIKAFEMYWHAEGMKTAYTGTVTMDGETYTVSPQDCCGYADKNWGRNFTSPWLWLSSNDLTSRLTGQRLENSVFDIGGGCPKVYFVPLPKKLLGAFWHENNGYEYNFSKFWTGTKTRFSCKETVDEIIWRVILENHSSVMKTEVHCCKADMLLVNYESPDGRKRHNRLWNGGNGRGRIRLYRKNHGRLVLVDDIDVGHIGCEYGEYEK